MRRRAFMQATASGVALSPLSTMDVSRGTERELYEVTAVMRFEDDIEFVIPTEEGALTALQDAWDYVHEEVDAELDRIMVDSCPLPHSTFERQRWNGELYRPQSGLYRRIKED